MNYLEKRKGNKREKGKRKSRKEEEMGMGGRKTF
jgi:hypothetical protein